MLLCRLCRMRRASGESLCRVWPDSELCGPCHSRGDERALGRRHAIEVPGWALRRRLIVLARVMLGAEMEQARRARGWRQRDLARVAGLAASCISRAECGKDCTGDVLDRIARVLYQPQ